MTNATVDITGSNIGTPLMQMLDHPAIEPGAAAGYQLCKEIYLYHPLGKKMVDEPLRLAQSQCRTLTAEKGPESLLIEAFQREWDELKCDQLVAMCARLGRIFGTGAIVMGVEGLSSTDEVDFRDLHKLSIFFNVLDPLNTSGSLVLNQDPNAPDFQKSTNITASNVPYARSRSVVYMNETPIYIAYTNSAFGYVGRSVYQRALFPMRSFVQSMITDDLVTRKAGLLVAKMKQAGALINKVMAGAAAVKRNLLKEGQTGNVLNIDVTEDVEAIDLKNTDTAMTVARKNILENIAAAAEMPAQILNNETFAEGFGEGTEDAKKMAKYVNSVRIELSALYAFFDRVVRYRAWNPVFYAQVQQDFPDQYGGVPYEKAFMEWYGCFKASWPNLLEEPDSEKAKNEDVKLKALLGVVELLMPKMDPENMARLVQWLLDNLNENQVMFPHSLDLDIKALVDYMEEQKANALDAAQGGDGSDGDGDGDNPGLPRLATAA